MNNTNNTNNPLRRMERYGVIAPKALKKVHMVRHNNDDEGTPSPTTAGARNNMAQNNTAESVNVTPAAEPAPPKDATLIEVSKPELELPAGKNQFTLKEVLEAKSNIGITVTHKQQGPQGFWGYAKDTAMKAGTIALGIGMVEGCKALGRLMFGRDDAPVDMG